MKVNKIQCDICGKIVDYNNVTVGTNEEWLEWLEIEDIEKFKINKITLNGIRETLIAPFKPVFIHMEYDLCEECLEKFYNLIYKIKNEGDYK